MFKKLKDKLSEEVKSSPQRIQQFAQAAQAAVTSASSSITDIANNDLFSIGDNDSQQGRPAKTEMSPFSQKSTFQDVSMVQPGTLETTTELVEHLSSHDPIDNQRQRRLSNSSFASDVSFRLPSYDSPSMYHLQSDMEISASEAEERGFSSGTIGLDRVTKEQIYAAYKRTQGRYTKYRTQYADLARHYKLLEKENAKARSVLVETQDKALRRISELREQCSLEQSAKAHLEKALRIEIDEKNIKMETLNTKIQLLQNQENYNINNMTKQENDVQLINLSADNENSTLTNAESSSSEITSLNNKIEKLETLVNKYKDSLKTTKEKNTQLTTELQRLASELENRTKENDLLKITTTQLNGAKEQIQSLNDLNEELQNKVNSYDFAKTKELSTLEIDLQKAQKQIEELHSKIEVFTKREEENAISLAENKLSIHKELESKEKEIKSLKDSLSASKKEMESLNIVLSDYKSSVTALEEERVKYTSDLNELNIHRIKMIELDSQIKNLTRECQGLQNLKSKADEEFKCLQLQLKQETAEKLAMIDRNKYLENRNTQLSDENSKKSSQISGLDSELLMIKKDKSSSEASEAEINKLFEEIDYWKSKYSTLESEIQEEREELVKLQSEIEKLLVNHEQIQIQNSELHNIVSGLRSERKILQEKVNESNKIKTDCKNMLCKVKDLKQMIKLTSQEIMALKDTNSNVMPILKDNISILIKHSSRIEEFESYKGELQNDYVLSQAELKQVSQQREEALSKLRGLHEENETLKSEIQIKNAEIVHVAKQLQTFVGKYEITLDELQLSKKEKQQLVDRLEGSENKFQQLLIDAENDLKLSISKKTGILEQQNNDIIQKNKTIESENVLLNKDIHELKLNYEKCVNKCNDLQKENDELIMKTEDSKLYVIKLEDSIQTITQENISLKSQSESITNSVKDLEFEIQDIKKSHIDIENENDRLNSILEKIEGDDEIRRNIQISLHTQTDASIQETKIAECQQDGRIVDEIDTFSEKSLCDESNLQKEENRRLQSDIAGLQSYLAKISKENSVLNDKLRELIASSENSPQKIEPLSNDFTSMENEIRLGKERNDELLRENTLLIDENLELKDQLNSHNYSPVKPKSANGVENVTEFSNLKEKYSNLLDTKHKLEKQLSDLEHMNNSINGNMINMQEHNEKLRLSNDKLERRLDEALVSLRHLHSLQENTELEYLRNILYEYLTGSGTHSITLAKVLAAVVKFDDSQTQQVMLKEKERQGINIHRPPSLFRMINIRTVKVLPLEEKLFLAV